MQDQAGPSRTAGDTRFWSPEFTYEHRADGTILMRQTGDLPPFLPTLADYLDRWANRAPDRPFLARRVDGGAWRSISYGEARETARALGSALLSLGLGPEKPLLILSENSLEHALLGLGALRVGVPFAPISPAYSLISEDHTRLKAVVDKLRPGAVFADDADAFAPALRSIAAQDRKVIVVDGESHDDAIRFDDLLRTAPEGSDEARHALTGQTVAKYLFTSGSTGLPKAVINTNHMLCANQAMVRDCYRFLETNPPVILDWAPWNHTAAGNKVYHMALTNGGTYYIDDGRPVRGKFDETLRNLREIAPTWYFNVPIAYDMLVEALEDDRALAETFFSRLTMMFYAGAAMSQHTWDRLLAVGREVTGGNVLLATGLGATETAPFALSSTTFQVRTGNIGVPSRGLTLKLVPADDKLEARLKGPSITPGYLGEPEQTADVFDEEGFYKLGDALRPADPDDLSQGFFFDGRVAENFKLSTGTWVAVGSVRAALIDALEGLVRDVVIVGENEPQLGALLLLSDAAKAMPSDKRRDALTEKLAAAAKAATGSASRVRRAVVLESEPSLARGEITEKGSLNQRALRSHHTDLIARLYAGGDGVFVI
jgi:feruloyl-CoA synthase